METLISLIFDGLFWYSRKFRIWCVSILLGIIVLFWIAQPVFKEVRTVLKASESNRITSRRGNALLFEIESFRKTNNTFPSNLEAVLRNNPLKRDWKIDGWGRNFYYMQTKDSFVLYSSGKDRIEGTNDDIYFNK
ncbi:MAG: type II secretion system protein GspG [Sporocytophaga sp.]|nr:type II secretion system protein GspG [Sporocytophaga sp.]